MGYRISYENGGAKRSIPDSKKNRNPKTVFWVLLVSAGIALFLLFQNEDTRRMILPGNGAVTEAAIKNLVETIRSGTEVGDAVTAFCREIIENAG